MKPRLLPALVLTCLAAGCGDVLKQPYPAKAYYGLEPGTPDVSATPAVTGASGSYVDADAVAVATARPTAGGVMLIRAVRVTPPYDGQAFVYRDGPAQYATDYYVNWIAPPAALLTGGLSEWLDRAGPLPVVASGSNVRADVVLDGEVTRLVVDRTDRARPRAVLSARFFVTRDTHASTTVLSDTSYTAEVPVAPDTPAGYAAAWGRAYRQVLERLTADLRTAVARP